MLELGVELKRSELIKLLKSNGVVFCGHGKSHDKYYSPITNSVVTIPRHSKEIATGTANNILKLTGVKKNG